MIPLLAALVALAAFVSISRLVLAKQAKLLVAREQAYRFHAIRDELEVLVLEGHLSAQEELTTFLRWVANLGIRNAGQLTLRQALQTAATVQARMPDGWQDENEAAFLCNIESRPEPVKRLVADTFEALAVMVIANDHLVSFGLTVTGAAQRAASSVKPLANGVRRQFGKLARLMLPRQATAVRYARDYSEVAHRFAG